MRVLRLPGIHHDSNVVVVQGSAGALLINAGTSWYQTLQVERVKGLLGEGGTLDRILLSSKRYPCSGGARYISEMFGDCPVHIHEEGQSALETGDFFTTWANRYDSDMPPLQTEACEDGEIFALGDGQLVALHTPGCSPDGMSYWIKEQSMMIVGCLLPRADRPARWDLPGGCLPDLIESLEQIQRRQPSAIVPMQGPAIRGKAHVQEVLNQHLDFLRGCETRHGAPPKSWGRPAPTAMWYTSHPPWSLEEKESV
jgi:glyoxylase-like metal-dependent hydrolase (beta-lactamase superfamily II)